MLKTIRIIVLPLKTTKYVKVVHVEQMKMTFTRPLTTK